MIAATPISSEQLRMLVRSVLREVLPAVRRQASPSYELATIQNDADLMKLVHRVVQLMDDPSKASALRNGDYMFKLNVSAATPCSVGDAVKPEKSKSTVEVKEGLITEKKVVGYIGEVSNLILGRNVVLTPGARDRARQAGIAIERSKS